MSGASVFLLNIGLFAASFWLAAVPVDNMMYPVRVLQAIFFIVIVVFGRFRPGSPAVRRVILFGGCLLLQPVIAVFFGNSMEGTLPDLGRQGYAVLLMTAMAAVVLKPAEENLLMAFLGFLALLTALACAYVLYVNGGVNVVASYSDLKQLKYDLAHSGLPLNSLTFTVSSTILLAGVWWRPTRRGLWLSVAVAFPVAAFFGSTTALISFVVAVVLAVVFIRFGPGRLTGSRPLLLAYAMVSVFAVYGIVLYLIGENWLLDAVNEATVGRAYMWVVAIDVFSRETVLGAGAMSWKTDMLPAISTLTSSLGTYEQVTGGGYHSVPLTTAAERGIVGIACLVAANYILIDSMVKAARVARTSPGRAYRTKATAVSIVVFFLLLRGIAEYSGYFAYANSHVDLLSFFFVAVLFRLLNPAAAKRAAHASEVAPPKGAVHARA